jgi:dipeptidyl aminopeptidase/acylaminoacyl peptidase
VEQPTPFDRLDDFITLPRLSGLALSPDGDRLVVTVAALNEKRTAYVSSLWEVDPAGRRPPQRLTWGVTGETAPAFLPDGALLFLTKRPDPLGAGSGSGSGSGSGEGSGESPDDEGPAALWMLPRTGEARPVVSRPGGIHDVVVARDRATIVFASPTLPSSTSADEDEKRRTVRKEAKVTAVLHDSYPVRHWDHDLGPDRDRLFAGRLDELSDWVPQEQVEPTDLTGHVGAALAEAGSWDVSPDGTRAVVSWQVAEPHGSVRQTLQMIDVASGERTVLLDDADHEYVAPRFSPDGAKVALVVESRSTPDRPVDDRVCVLHLDGGELHDAAPDWDRWGRTPVWTPDGSALLVTADDHGRSPVWRLDLDTRTARRLTGDDGAYSDLQLSRDGSALYAVRSAIGTLPAPVRLDPALTDQPPVTLLCPVRQPAVPGSVTEVAASAADGTSVRAWLVLPRGAGADAPAPLALFVHGGPLSSWNGWHWRWNPWLAAARGYAVLLPDPALSTGYGLAAVTRGWGRWGFESYQDLMSLTDAAMARDDIDAARTAALGGSYGGYMANWIAGHTDRFRGIVSHAGLWSLEEFGLTTDAAHYWQREMTQQMSRDNSPNRSVARIRTPMLVIHGDRDYRVPVGEALRLWTELARQNEAPDGAMPHRFLLFPDENHWIRRPQHTKVWYETVFAFLDHTVHGKPWEAPDLLR